MTKNRIILPDYLKSQDPVALANRQRYETDEALRCKANEIHMSQMLPPPACDECIALAIRQLDQSESKGVCP